jgi:hypothetical protein
MNQQSELPHELESKQIEKAQIRKVVWLWLGTSSASILLLLLNRLHPSSVVRWLLFAFVLVQAYCFYRVARVSQELKSVLPPAMEAKRIQIAKRHNSLCAVMLLAMIAPWVVVLILPCRNRSLIWLAALATGITALYGIRRIIRHDDEMCQRLRYLCPLCRKPLYEPRASTYLTGVCPKCKKSILPELSGGREAVHQVEGLLLRS